MSNWLDVVVIEVHFLVAQTQWGCSCCLRVLPLLVVGGTIDHFLGCSCRPFIMHEGSADCAK